MSRMFSLSKDEAVKEVGTVVNVGDGWKQHFAACGVTAGDIELYAQHIDRPFLKISGMKLASAHYDSWARAYSPLTSQT